jgi:hypothetical protein
MVRREFHRSRALECCTRAEEQEAEKAANDGVSSLTSKKDWDIEDH